MHFVSAFCWLRTRESPCACRPQSPAQGGQEPCEGRRRESAGSADQPDDVGSSAPTASVGWCCFGAEAVALLALVPLAGPSVQSAAAPEIQVPAANFTDTHTSPPPTQPSSPCLDRPDAPFDDFLCVSRPLSPFHAAHGPSRVTRPSRRCLIAPPFALSPCHRPLDSDSVAHTTPAVRTPVAARIRHRSRQNTTICCRLSWPPRPRLGQLRVHATRQRLNLYGPPCLALSCPTNWTCRQA